MTQRVSWLVACRLCGLGDCNTAEVKTRGRKRPVKEDRIPRSGSEVSLTARRSQHNSASGLRTKSSSPQTDRSRLERAGLFGVGVPRARVRWVVFEERSQRRPGRGVARAPWRARDTGRLPKANEPACLHSIAGDRCSGPERRNKRA